MFVIARSPGQHVVLAGLGTLRVAAITRPTGQGLLRRAVLLWEPLGAAPLELVLRRPQDVVLSAGPAVSVTAVRVSAGYVRLGFLAPRGVRILRGERAGHGGAGGAA